MEIKAAAFNFSLPFSGETYFKAPDKLEGNFKVTNQEALKETLGKEIDQNLELDFKVLGDKAYFKTPLLSKVWYRLESKITKETPSSGATNLATNLEKIKSSFKEAKRLDDEKIDGQPCYHYQYVLDFPKYAKSVLGEEFNLPDWEKIENMNFQLECWIEKGNFVIKKDKIQVSFSFPVYENMKGESKFTFEGTYQDYGRDFSIQAPKRSLTLNLESLLKDSQLSSVVLVDLKRKADLLTVQEALDKYYEVQKIYPTSLDDSRDGDFMSALIPDYLEKSLVDPTHPKYYYKYQPLEEGKSYKLTCVLENPNDPEGTKVGNLLLYILQP